jgi:hypothetical protein
MVTVKPGDPTALWWKQWYWIMPFEVQKRNKVLKLLLITYRVKVCITLTLLKLINNNYLHQKIMEQTVDSNNKI